ncbi:MAG TPA: LLM class flavin-dependent oxidoreductase [Chloroflexia bacterium]|nr:LLM class flavin-dependent oxidoreductase [Chloroflexia bacterium]
MKYGFVIPGGDVLDHLEIAQEIEAAGWDGVFVADMVYGTDPWVSLAAIAALTKRVRLGTLLTPVSRRRPWKLASETATLDRLSQGRAILAVGLGATDTGFDKVGEATDRKVRAQLLDEGLDVITRFWSGKPFSYHGKHYNVQWGTDWTYTPVQSPRIPIWVVGAWPREASVRRAARYDGVLASKMSDSGGFSQPTPDDIREIKAFVDKQRSEAGLDTGMPFDIVVEGVTPGKDPEKTKAILEPLAEAGATWWIESMWMVTGGMKAVRKRIAQGPPQIGRG